MMHSVNIQIRLSSKHCMFAHAQFVVWFCVTELFTVTIISECVSPVAVPCPPGKFGDNCSKECHCRSGPSYCRTDDGRCTDGKCRYGWTGSPYCQTGLYILQFGLDCMLHVWVQHLICK